MAHCTIQTFDLKVHTPDEAAVLLASGCGCDELAKSPASAFDVDTEAPASDLKWHGVIGTEGEMTGDGRYIESGALEWSLPIPMRWASSDIGGHDGAQVVGRILTIERLDNGDLFATGDFDGGSAEGREAARQVGAELTNGVSMDLDNVAFEIQVAKNLLESAGGLDALAKGDFPENEEGTHGIVMSGNPTDEVMVTKSGRVRAATMVGIPAFSRAKIAMVAPEAPEDEQGAEAAEDEGASFATDEVPDTEEQAEGVFSDAVTPSFAPATTSEIEQLVAGGFPAEPPVEWFNTPELDGPTPITVTKDGRVYGHLAVWGTCHTAYTGQCVEPPHSRSNYAYFRTGAVLTREGAEIPTGALTLDTLHAKAHLGAAETLAHYEHTGRGVADVAAGEDVYGIWVAGALRPGVTVEQVRALRASPLSGDWRRIGGGLELVAALAVNVPGFPVPRPQGLVASGVVQTLVASGMVAPRTVTREYADGLSAEDLRYLKALAARERQTQAAERVGLQTKADEMASRLRATKVAEMAAKLAKAE